MRNVCLAPFLLIRIPAIIFFAAIIVVGKITMKIGSTGFELSDKYIPGLERKKK
ncbi:hypothetical protein Ab1vBOLIVR6_gp31c [Agrobacterium phage OLIVR6]|nr:hypothetical protein Ab1vBOLIVR6_gp31c [Agrobacterium phage OLIVR6]